MKKYNQFPVFKVFLLILVFAFSGNLGVQGEEFSEELIEARRQAQEDIQKAIRKAETLANEGSYVEAFRLLFDTSYGERRIALLFILEGDNDFPLIADTAIRKLEHQLIYGDQSPLMQIFRDLAFPIQEKLMYTTELRRLASTKGQHEEESLFRGRYGGTLVQLITSDKLSVSEKYEILRELQFVIQNKYISGEQQDNIQAEIAHLQQEAEQQFQEFQYIEAFILMDNASEMACTIQLSGGNNTNLIRQQVRMFKEFVSVDTSSLMQVFKDWQVPTRTRQLLLYDLREMIASDSLSTTSDTIMLQGETYHGKLVQILVHPQIQWATKDSILGNIDVEILKKEADYVPEPLLGLDEAELKEFLKVWEQYKKDRGRTD